MPQNLTIEQVDDLTAKGLYTPEQANEYKTTHNLFSSSPNKPETPINDHPIIDGLKSLVNDNDGVPSYATVPSPNSPVIAPQASNVTVQAPTVLPPNTTVQPTQVDNVPTSIAAPGVKNTTTPVTFSQPVSNTPGQPANQFSPINPEIGSPNYVGNLQENENSSLSKLQADKEIKLGQLDKQIDAFKSSGAGTIGNPTYDNLVKQRNATEAAFNIGESKIKSQYPLDETGHVDFSKIKPGQFSAKQLGIFGASEGLLTAEDNKKAAAARIDAFTAEQNAQKARNDLLTNAAVEKGQIINNNIELQKQHQNTYDLGIKELNNKYDEASKNFEGATIDPARYWKQTPTAGLIGIAIFSGLEQAFKGLAARGNPTTPSSIVQTVNQIVAQDIDAQKAEIDKKGKAVNMAANAVAHYREQGLDTKSSDAAALQQGLLKAAQLVDTITAQTQNPIDQAKAEQIKQGLIIEANNAKATAIQPSINALIKLLVPTPVAGGTQITYDPKSNSYFKVNGQGKVVGYATPAETKAYEENRKVRAEGNKLEGEAGSGNKDQNDRTIIIEGTPTVFKNKETADEERIKTGYAQEVLDITRRLRELGTKDTGFSANTNSHNHEIEALQVRLANTAGKLTNPTQAVSQAEADSIKDATDPGRFGKPNNTGVLESYEKQAKDAIEKAKRNGVAK